MQCSHHHTASDQNTVPAISFKVPPHTRTHAAASAEAGTCQQPPLRVPLLLLPAVTSPASLLLSCCWWRRPRVVPLSWKEAEPEAGEAARPGR